LGKDCKYDEEIDRLQIELVKLQEWIKTRRLRLVVFFEGRDAAGKALYRAG
jgi:polyphosphate kinase 2 (PPK2 family)